MKRDTAILDLRASRKELQNALAGLTDEDLARPRAVGKLTVKDLLALIAAWDEEIVRILQAFSMQAAPQFSYQISDKSNFAVWNEQEMARRRERPAADVVGEFESARRDLIQIIEGLTDPVLARPKLTSWGKTLTGFQLIEMQAERDRDFARQITSFHKKIERWARARQKLTAKRKTKS